MTTFCLYHVHFGRTQTPTKSMQCNTFNAFSGRLSKEAQCRDKSYFAPKSFLSENWIERECVSFEIVVLFALRFICLTTTKCRHRVILYL